VLFDQGNRVTVDEVGNAFFLFFLIQGTRTKNTATLVNERIDL
jgi:hypothetical protein